MDPISLAVMGIFGLFGALFALEKRKAAARGERIKAAYTFNPATPGSARFATEEDCKAGGLFRGIGVPIGYLCGRALHYLGVGHILTVAAARTGKGATQIINALLSWSGSVIVFDPKGENAAVTGHGRLRFGPVYVLNPFEMLPNAFKGLKHACVNPMVILDPALPSFHAICDKLAAACVWDEGKEGTHWTTGARILVSGIIAALMRHGAPHEKNLPMVARIISGDVYGFCRLTLQKTTDPFIVDKLNRFALPPGTEPSREIEGVRATAVVQLGFIGNAAIAKSLSGSDFRFADLKRKPGTTVYICLPLDLLDVADKYFRLILDTAIADLLAEGRR